MRALFIILFVFFAKVSCCQSKFNYEWVQGALFKSSITRYDSGVFKYNRDYDTTQNYAYWFSQGSNICDSNGRVLLLSNGYNVLDSNKNFIDGLDSIGGREFIKLTDGYSGYCQNSIFLPIANGIYYFVNTSASDSFLNYFQNNPVDFDFDELMYCKIDIHGNGGAGKVLQREVKIIEKDTLRDTQMMACRHANGKDWWLIKQGVVNNRMHKFLFTEDSVYNYGTESFAGVEFSKFDHGGQSMFSQDGTKFATTNRGTGRIFVADFDRCTGVLSNPMVYNVDTLSAHNPNDTTQKDFFTEGLAFSPNGRFIYVYMYFNIQQLDLWDNNPNTRWSTVAGLDTTWDAFQSYSGLYIGPDNKLYMGNWATFYCKQMSYFNNPDAKGLASDFCSRCLRFPNYGVTSPPTMPNYDLGEDLPCWALGNSEIVKNNDDFEVFPNPSSIIFYIKTESKEKRELYNSVGQLLFSTYLNEINVSRYSKGIYYIRVENSVRKVIIE